MCGCETWSLTHIEGETQDVGVRERSAVGIFVFNRNKVKWGWRNWHSEDLPRSALLTRYYAHDRIKKNEAGEACDTCWRDEAHK